MRVPFWESKLQKYLEEIRYKPFEYGKNDCCSFTIQAQKIITGSTLFSEFEGTYTNLEEGKAILKKLYSTCILIFSYCFLDLQYTLRI